LRQCIAPNVPSVVESGYPTQVASPILGFVGHRDMPLALRQKIAADGVAVLQDKALGERMALTGQPVAPMGVEEFAAGVNEQQAQVTRIAKLLGIARKNEYQPILALTHVRPCVQKSSQGKRSPE